MDLRQLTTRTLEILPGPFDWCVIPAGKVQLRGVSGQFSVGHFIMSAYPVTYAQYQTFIDALNGFNNPAWWRDLAVDEQHRTHPGTQEWPIDTHPRENVSWYDAVAFCRWLEHQLGIGIRLPTEWEWQWAAQGSEGHKFPWGSDFDPARCNTKENGIFETTPVNAYPDGASPFGVLDMVGNVWEWCVNRYDVSSNIKLEGTADRVMRGGTWGYDRSYGNTIFRERGAPDGRYVSDGFRIVSDFRM